MKNVVPTLTALVLLFCSCNMDRYYAGKRIGHSQPTAEEMVAEPENKPELLSPVNSGSDTCLNPMPQTGIQRQTFSSETKRPGIQKTKKTAIAPIVRHKEVRKNPVKKIRTQLNRCATKMPFSRHHDTKDGGNITLALVLIGLLIGIIVAIASGSPLAGVLVGIGVVLLVIIGIAAGIALVFWFLFKVIFESVNSR